MKILEVDFKAFGPFTNAKLDFRAGQPGFHLVYGRNEAGKSSALRGLNALLFDFEPRFRDDFVHEAKNIAILGRLGHPDGRELALTRTRRKKARSRGSLLELDRPDQAGLAEFLGPINRETYGRMFSLSHEVLVEEGLKIINDKSRLDEIIFAASGLAQVNEIKDGLAAEAGALFKPRATTSLIHKLLAELRAGQDRLRDLSLSEADWSRMDEDLRQAGQDVLAKQAARQAARQRYAHLERIKKALPILARRADCLRELSGLGDALVLPDDFGPRARDLLKERELSGQQRRDLMAELERLSQDIAACPPQEKLLGLSGQIEALRDALGGYKSDLTKKEKLLKEREAGLFEARKLMRDLSLDPDTSAAEVEILRPNRQAEAEANELLDEWQTLQASLARLDEDRAAREQEAACLEQDLADLPAEGVSGLEALKAALDVAREHLSLEEDCLARQKDCAARERALQDEALAMGWTHPLDDLAGLRLPEAETLDIYLDNYRRSEDKTKNLQARLEQVRAEARQAEESLAGAGLAGGLPDEAGLMAARSWRDRGWDLVCQAWLEGAGPDEPAYADDLAAFLAVFPGERLERAYERALAESDHLADRLRREHERLGRLVRDKAALTRCRQEEEDIEALLTALADEQARLRETCLALWDERLLEVKVVFPKNMRPRLSAWQKIVAGVRALRIDQAGLAVLRERLSDVLALLEQAAANSRTDSLAAAVKQAESRLAELNALKETRQVLSGALKNVRASLAQEARRRQDLTERLTSWQDQWTSLAGRLELGETVVVTAARDILSRRKDLFAGLDRLEAMDNDLRDLDQNARKLALAAEGVGRALGEPAAQIELVERIQTWVAALTQAQDEEKTRRNLEKNRQEVRTKIDRLEAGLNSASRELNFLFREAGCTEETFSATLDKSERLKRLRLELEAVNRELLAIGDGLEPERLEAEAASVDRDSLDSDLEALREQADVLKESVDELNRRIGGLEAERAALSRSVETARLSSEITDTKAALEAGLSDYLRLRLAGYALDRAMEAYRDKSKNTLIDLASKYFQAMTLNSFAGVMLHEDGRSGLTLAGARPDRDDPVPLSAMSRGSADQLYLALRLAYLTDYARRADNPLPVILDDILINFDDARSAATLKILAGLATDMQIIFFTHHRHLCELARQSLPDGALFVHELKT